MKIVGNWTNEGICRIIDDKISCKFGLQKQIRTCLDGKDDKCSWPEKHRTVLCYGNDIELCPEKSNLKNTNYIQTLRN